MSFTYSQKFTKINGYLLLEYNYASVPNPETYYVNTGNPSVGFEKIVNGYYSNSVQILNRPEDFEITGNHRNTSVVQVGDNRFISLSEDYLNPYLNTDPKLTPESNLPVTFDYNLGVQYDTARFHVVSGYSFDNIDGIIIQIRFTERSTKKAIVAQVLIKKSDTDNIKMNPNPIYLGGALFDHYFEIKIPSFNPMVYEFEVLDGSPFQADSLAAKISSDGYGFLRNSPIEFAVYEVNQTSVKNGYDNYITQLSSQLAIECLDNYSSLAAVVQENTNYNYVEYFPTWEGNFLEDFLNMEGRVGRTYYVINEIEVREQVGLSYITTHNFSSLQTNDFNAPMIFRPVLVNPLTTSFLVNYTMKLVDKYNNQQIVRTASIGSYDINKYGREVNKITLTTGAYSQKVYNKIVNAPNLIGNNLPANPATPTERRIPIFYKDTNISITQESLIVNKDGDIVTESSSPDSLKILGQGKANIILDPFDNFYKFTLYNVKAGTTPEILDLGTSLSYFLVFIDNNNQQVKVENIKNRTNISDPSKGQISFKMVEGESKKILGFTNRDFYITSRTPDSVETKVYSGTWKNQTEAKAAATATTTPANSLTSTQPTVSTKTATSTTVSVAPPVTAPSVENPASVNRASQVSAGVPNSDNPNTPVEFKEPYNLGSSSILSTIPSSVLEGNGLIASETIDSNRFDDIRPRRFTKNVINQASLTGSIGGLEAQGMKIPEITNYHFKPESPGFKLFSGLTKEQYLISCINLHPKLADGSFDAKYIQYCNSVNLPVKDYNK